MRPENFFNIDDMTVGIPRELAPGVTTTIYTGDQAMVSIVRFEPDKKGTLHHHPEEQWGFCLEGSATRYQGDHTVEVRPGDFWRTPANIPHTMESGDEGVVVLDVFAPPRKIYTTEGKGFGEEEK